MLRWALLAAILLISAAVGWIIWENRGSEKLLTAALAVLGVGAALFVFTPPSSFSDSFGTTFFMNAETQLPVSPPPELVPFSSATLHVTTGAKTTDRHWAPDNSGGMRLYHHVLQRAILNWLSMRYQKDWRIEIAKFTTATAEVQQFGGRSESGPEGTVIGEPEVKRAFAANKFIDLPAPSFALQVVVPPQMRMTVEVPSDSDHGSIEFENRYYKLTIQTQPLSTGMFIGRYALLFGVADNDRRLTSVDFGIRISGKSKRPFQMHPDIPQFEAWAKQITEGLHQECDEAERWKSTMERVNFRHMLPQRTNVPKRSRVVFSHLKGLLKSLRR